MRFEAHSEGVTVRGPAVVIRNGAYLSGLTPQKPENNQVCPKCGQSGFSCCSYADRTDISAEALSMARQPVNPAASEQEEANDTAASALRVVPSTGNSASLDRNEIQHRDANPDSSSSSGDDARTALHNGIVPPANAAEQSGQHSDEEHSASSGTQKELSDEEKQEVQEMKSRDAEVRAHEQAHLAAAGSLARGGANFEYEEGPDGQKYAVAGDVSISFGGDTPEERLRQAEQAARAAMAPAEPSAQDRSVANEARAQANQARQEIAQESAEGNRGVEGFGSAEEEMGNAVASPVDADSDDENASPFSVSTAGAQADQKSASASNAQPTTNPYARAASAYRSQMVPSTSMNGNTAAQNHSLEAAMLPGRLFAVSA